MILQQLRVTACRASGMFSPLTSCNQAAAHTVTYHQTLPRLRNRAFVLPPPLHTVACYSGDRNELRSRIIQWLQMEVVPDGWFSKGSNFSDILLKYFKVGATREGRLCDKVIFGFRSVGAAAALQYGKGH